MYFLLTVLVCVWGIDYAVAKHALTDLDPLSLIFFKYSVAAAFVLVVRLRTEKGPFFKKKDIWLFAVCAVVGDILYFFSEYTAMDYMPVSLISIVISLVPIVSIVTEAIFFKRRTSKKIIIGVFICIFGIALIIGVDWQILFEGRIIGYILAFVCVISWNIYNFITEAMHERYQTATLTFNQLLCTLIILAPYIIYNRAELPAATPALAGEVIYLGLVSAGIGFLIQVRGLHVLGPTTSVLFANFLPVTTTFFGWLFLGEIIEPVQIIGGVIVVATGYFVIKEKGKSL